MRQLKARWFSKSGFGKDPVAMHGAPVSFSGRVGGLGAGENEVVDASALQNGYRTPYYIDEIRMTSWFDSFLTSGGTPDPYSQGTAPQTLGYATKFLFRVGAHKISDEPIPMGSYGPNYNGTALGEIYSNGQGRFGSSQRWLLPKPLLMQPGDVILATVFRDASAGSAVAVDANATVTYVGRALPPGAKTPLVRNVPWVAKYEHAFSQSYSRTGVNGKNPFQNPFTNPLTVHRLTGKVANIRSDQARPTSGSFLSNFGPVMLPVTGVADLACYMEDSQGYKITRAFTSVGAIFDTGRNAWTYNRAIGPREQIDMQFQLNGATDSITAFVVGLIGHREEAA